MVPVRACSQLISITPVPMVMVAGVSVPLYLQARCQGLAGSGPVQEDKGVYFLAKGQKINGCEALSNESEKRESNTKGKL